VPERLVDPCKVALFIFIKGTSTFRAIDKIIRCDAPFTLPVIAELFASVVVVRGK